MLTDEEIQSVYSEFLDIKGSAMEFARRIERAVLAKAMPIPKQEPVNNRYCGHDSLADMVSTHIHVWRTLLEDEHARNNSERPYITHELNALSDIEGAIKFELDNPFRQLPAQAAAIPNKRPIPELLLASYHEAKGWNDCIDAMLPAYPPTQQSNK